MHLDLVDRSTNVGRFPCSKNSPCSIIKCTEHVARQQNSETASVRPICSRRFECQTGAASIVSIQIPIDIFPANRFYSRASIGPTRIRYNGPVGARSAVRGTKKGLKRPLTAEELDKELDAFMGDSNSTSVSIERGVATTETSAVTQDVMMA